MPRKRKTCTKTFEGKPCRRKLRSLGMCATHYRRHQRGATPEEMDAPAKGPHGKVKGREKTVTLTVRVPVSVRRVMKETARVESRGHGKRVTLHALHAETLQSHFRQAPGPTEQVSGVESPSSGPM